VFNASLAWWYYIAGRNENAIAQADKTIDFAPNHFFAHWVRGLAFAQQGAYPEAIVSLQSAVSLDQFEDSVRGDLGRVLAMAGEREEAIRILDDFRAKGSGSYISPANFAKVYVGLGEYDEAFKQLEKAAAERAVKLPWFLVDPCLTPVRSDPRFADLLARTGLPPISMSVNV
jgi:tetratricopeptide (TPR) repeat protein